MPHLVEYCDVIIGNEEDIQHFLGIVVDEINVTKGGVQVSHYKPILDKVCSSYPNLQ